MDRWLKKYVEVPRKEDLMRYGKKLAFYDYLTQGIDNKEVIK